MIEISHLLMFCHSLSTKLLEQQAATLIIKYCSRFPAVLDVIFPIIIKAITFLNCKGANCPQTRLYEILYGAFRHIEFLYEEVVIAKTCVASIKYIMLKYVVIIIIILSAS